MAGRRNKALRPKIVDSSGAGSLYQRIKEAIVNGSLAPGAPLVETTLAEWWQVSRTPIREALLRLEQDGLVVRSDRGLVVRTRSPEEILDIYETRIVLEATAARVAATRRSDLDVLRLRRIVDSLSSIDATDVDAMVSANREFHSAVWRASHNESLVDLLTRLDFHLARYPATTLAEPGRWEQGNKQHREIVDAIERRDASRAAELATEHFTQARDIRLRIWARGEA